MKIFAPICLLLLGLVGYASSQQSESQQGDDAAKDAAIQRAIAQQELDEAAMQQAIANQELAEKRARIDAESARYAAWQKDSLEMRALAEASRKVKISQQALRQMLEKYRSSTDEADREELQNKIKSALEDAYILRMDAYDDRISQVHKKLQQMEEQLNKHRSAMDEIVELRAKLLIKNAELGEFPNGSLFEANSQGPGLSRFGSSDLSGLFQSGQSRLSGSKIPKNKLSYDLPNKKLGVGTLPVRPTISPLPPSRESKSPIPPAVGVPTIGRDRGVEPPISRFVQNPGPPTPAFRNFAESLRRESTNDKIFFASEKMLKDGKLSIIGNSDPGNKTTVSFSDEQDSIGVTLQPGKYAYRYEQGGEVWGKGEFVKSKGKRQFIEIETGEFTTHMLEKHKVSVKFKADPRESVNLFVQGIDSEFNANEFTGDFPGEMEFKYLPGNYLFVFSSNDYKSIQTFTVKSGEAMTVDMNGKKKSKK
ncbi:MAG: hypothetical protein AB8B55_02105 [Mariniblastus sp.]